MGWRRRGIPFRDVKHVFVRLEGCLRLDALVQGDSGLKGADLGNEAWSSIARLQDELARLGRSTLPMNMISMQFNKR